jgi:nitrogen regulatory protein PII
MKFFQNPAAWHGSWDTTGRGLVLHIPAEQPEHRPDEPTGKGISNMKMVMAVVKPFKLDEIREALTPLGVEGMTVSEVKGFGRQKGQAEIYRGAEYTVNFLPKVKLEIAVGDDLVEGVVETIQKSAQTGKIGDGKIFVYDLSTAVRIRTGESDADAL